MCCHTESLLHDQCPPFRLNAVGNEPGINVRKDHAIPSTRPTDGDSANSRTLIADQLSLQDFSGLSSAADVEFANKASAHLPGNSTKMMAGAGPQVMQCKGRYLKSNGVPNMECRCHFRQMEIPSHALQATIYKPVKVSI